MDFYKPRDLSSPSLSARCKKKIKALWLIEKTLLIFEKRKSDRPNYETEQFFFQNKSLYGV